jgi:hypothetical protein
MKIDEPGTAIESRNGNKVIYWRREIPPLDADILGEHTVEATSHRVKGTLTHGHDLWEVCYDRLMATTSSRLEQEVARLGGDYAHVLHEVIDTRRDDATDEAWLHGQFTYVLSRRPA